MLACAGDAPVADVAPEATVVDSAGTAVVRFSSLAGLNVPERATHVLAEVGRDADSGLFRVTGARLLGSGTLAIGNGGTGEVVYAAPDGTIIRRVGGQGDGPGEFRAITSMPDVRGDTLTIYDVRLGRLTVLAPDGAVLDTRSLPPPSRVVDVLPLAIDGDRIIAVQGESRIFASSGTRQDTVPLMIVTPAGVDTLSRWPGSEWTFGTAADMALRTEYGFGRSVQTSGRDGRALVGSTERLRVVLVGANGTTIMRLEGVQPNRAVTDDDVERWRADRIPLESAGLPAAYRRMVENAPHHPTYPAFSDVLLDADGRVWIAETPDYGAAQRRWIVFAPDGAPSFSVTLAADSEPLDAAGDHVAVLVHSEFDEEFIRLARLGPREEIR